MFAIPKSSSGPTLPYVSLTIRAANSTKPDPKGFSLINSDQLGHLALFLLPHEAIQLDRISRQFKLLTLSASFWNPLIARDYALDSKLESYSHSKEFYRERTLFRKNLSKDTSPKAMRCDPSKYAITIIKSKAFDVTPNKLAYGGLLEKSKYILGGDSSSHIVVKDTTTDLETLIATGSEVDITCLKFFGNQVFAGNSIGEFIVGDIEAGSAKFFPAQTESPLVAFVVDADSIISGSSDGHIYQRKMSDFSFLRQLEGCRGELYSLALNNDHLACGSDGGVSIWDLKNDNPPNHFPSLETPIISLNWDADLLYGGDCDGKIGIWHVPTGEMRKVIDVHPPKSLVNSLHLRENMLISSGSERQIKVVSLATFQTLGTHQIPASQIELDEEVETDCPIKLEGTRIVYPIPERYGLAVLDFGNHPVKQTKFKRVLSSSHDTRFRRRAMLAIACAICLVAVIAIGAIAVTKHYA